jgi:hypothetical protein
MIQTTQDTSTQSKPWIAEQGDFIGQIWKESTNQMLRFRIFSNISGLSSEGLWSI